MEEILVKALAMSIAMLIFASTITYANSLSQRIELYNQKVNEAVKIFEEQGYASANADLPQE